MTGAGAGMTVAGVGMTVEGVGMTVASAGMTGEVRLPDWKRRRRGGHLPIGFTCAIMPGIPQADADAGAGRRGVAL